MKKSPQRRRAEARRAAFRRREFLGAVETMALFQGGCPDDLLDHAIRAHEAGQRTPELEEIEVHSAVILAGSSNWTLLIDPTPRPDGRRRLINEDVAKGRADVLLPVFEPTFWFFE